MAEWRNLPGPSGEVRYVRDQFNEARVDDFTSPPGQAPESFKILDNVIVGTNNSIIRRWGTDTFATYSVAAMIPQRIFPMHFTSGANRFVLTAGDGSGMSGDINNVQAINEDGVLATTAQPIFVPYVGASVPHATISRDYVFFCDGATATYESLTLAVDMLKWNGTDDTALPSSVRFWGILDPENEKLVNGELGVSSPMDVANGSPFAPQIGAAAFTGAGLNDATSGGTFTGLDDTVYTVAIDSTGTPNTFSWGVGGSSTNGGTGIDLTGAAQTLELGVTIAFAATTGHTLADKWTFTAATATGITLKAYRNYFIIYRNSVTGTTSDVSFVASGGITTNGSFIVSHMPISGDPQVDQRILVATADGGANDTLYEVARLTNSSGLTTDWYGHPIEGANVYKDTLSEQDLLAQNIWAELDANGNQVGIIGNTSPRLTAPTALLSKVYRGRMYLLQNNTLFWSKNLGEVTTSTGNVTTRWEEAFPIANQFSLSINGSEKGTALWTDEVNLYIGTNSAVYTLGGDPGQGVQPRVLFHEVGVLNNQVPVIVWHEGHQVGSVWATPDHRIIFSDFNTYKDIGCDIEGDNSIQTALNALGDISTTACATFTADQENEFYFFAPGNGSPSIYALNVKTQKWMGRWYVVSNNGDTDAIRAMANMYDATNTPPRVLTIFSTGDGHIHNWKSTSAPGTKYYTDYYNARPYVQITTNWLDFGDPALTKLINAVEIHTNMSSPTVSIECANDPGHDNPYVISARSFETSTINGIKKAHFADAATHHRFYRLTWVVPSADTGTDLLSYIAIEYVPFHYS